MKRKGNFQKENTNYLKVIDFQIDYYLSSLFSAMKENNHQEITEFKQVLSDMTLLKRRVERSITSTK